jgi:hypothetical protein
MHNKRALWGTVVLMAVAGCGEIVNEGYGLDTDAITGCKQVSTVLVYAQQDYLTIAQGLAAHADRCTRYYVSLPALAADKTMPRSGENGQNIPDAIRAFGPNFHAMAEFSWSGWHRWIADSPGTRTWQMAGKLFRQRMVDAGYRVDLGDIWEVNEFPSTTRTGANGTWEHEEAAVKGLWEGDGAHVKGLVFMMGMGQGTTYLDVYKEQLRGWLSHASFWAAMNAHVKWFAQEVYPDPHFDCVGSSNVLTEQAHMSAYLEHLPRLAAAGPHAADTAFAYLDHAYVPLFGAAWRAKIGYGETDIPFESMIKFLRLEVYSTHFWAAHHAYPDRRIGFAWAPPYDRTTADQRRTFANVLGGSIQRSYPYDGFWQLGKYACSTTGSLDGCGCAVEGGHFNEAWSTMATW